MSLSCLSVVGCGGGSDDGTDEVAGDTTAADTTGADTTESSSGADTTESTTDTTTDTTGDTTGADTTDTTGADTTDTTETGLADCQVWEITYDLTNSEFEISGTPFGAGDQVNTVVEVDGADDEIGPGSMVLHFEDIGGDPGGMAYLTTYDMNINFVVSGPTNVTTDLVVVGEPTGCGLASGMLANGEVAWSGDEMADVHTMGTILCEGNLCGLGGLPNGMAVPVDDTAPQATSPFMFNNDLTTFTMDQTVIQMDAQSTTSWTFEGTETSRELVDAPPCACAP